MGRRALKPIPKDLDYSDYIQTEEMLPDLITGDALFHRLAPLEIEVGSGKGMFMAKATVGMPEHNFIGIEVRPKYARFSAARLKRETVNNGIMIQGDALKIIKERVPQASLDGIHVYFPDPWWKTRHRKRRVMNEAFIQDIGRVLKPEGKLHFWTDVQEYFETTLRLIEKTTDQLTGPIEVNEEAPEHDLDYQTNFERRKRMHGHPIYRSLYLRK